MRLKAEVEAAGAWRVRLGAALESGPLRMGSTKRGWLWLVTIGTDDTSDADRHAVTLDSCLLYVEC